MLNLLDSENTGTPFIWRDLKWIDRIPTALIELLDGGVPTGQVERIQLTPGCFIGLNASAEAVESAGLSTQRYCAGFAKALVDGVGFEQVSCPEHSLIEKGKQCARCEARDEFSAIHGLHRGSIMNDAAQKYADLEHWLYIATFPDGTSKVGTSSLHSKPRRLDEQAVACATYVAHAKDGKEVRVWEDLVSREAGLVQGKLVSAKYKAWTDPRPAAELKTAHEQAVSLAHWTLQEAALLDDLLEEDQIITEPWVPSTAMNRAYASLRAENPEPVSGYQSLLGTANGFYVIGAAGKFLVVHFGDPDAAFLVNTYDLANRAVLPYDQLAEQPTVQNSLF